MKSRPFRLVAGFVVLALGISGCAGYRLGTTLPEGMRSIYVSTFANETTEPRLEFDMTSAMLQELQKEGTFRVTGAADADTIMDAKLVKYQLDPLRYRKDLATTAREYRIRIWADVVLKKTSNQKILAQNKNVEGEATFLVTTDLRSDELRARPLAARDLAHHIVESVVEYW